MELHHSTKSELTNLFLDKDYVAGGATERSAAQVSANTRVPRSDIMHIEIWQCEILVV